MGEGETDSKSKFNLVDALDRFNRKERFWLLNYAVGEEVPDNVNKRIPLSEAFIGELKKQLPITIPRCNKEVWWAFDYHLDWLFAVLHFAPEYNVNFDWRRIQ